jgi:hypothetical protein
MEDGLEYAIAVGEDFGVPHPQELPAIAFEECGAGLIIGQFLIARMCCAIYFNDQLGGAAGEIGNVGSDGQLTDEFQIIKTAAAQVFPQALFGGSVGLPQLAGAFELFRLEVGHCGRMVKFRMRGKGPSSGLRPPSPTYRREKAHVAKSPLVTDANLAALVPSPVAKPWEKVPEGRMRATFHTNCPTSLFMKPSHFRSSLTSMYSSGLCACSMLPGPQMTAGMPICWNNPASVQ